MKKRIFLIGIAMLLSIGQLCAQKDVTDLLDNSDSVGCLDHCTTIDAQMEHSFDHVSAADETLAHFTSSLNNYGALWNHLYCDKYQVKDTVDVSLYCDITVNKVADCDDYVTYRYRANVYNGGLHDLPRSYYITYDKRRGTLLNAANFIKPAQMQAFRKMVIKSLKPEFDLWRGESSTWDEFTCSIFSFHTPVDYAGEMSDAIRSMAENLYPCDKWSGWTGDAERYFTERNFPLAHLAVLPDGIVLTYHPYQIDCFAAGEYHAVVPFKDAAPCLKFDKFRHEELKPKLDHFIRE